MSENNAKRSNGARRQRVVIVGGGTGGITVAARLFRQSRHQCEVTIIEPSDKHFYQPLWTLVGAGVVRKEASSRPQASVIPKGASWIRDRVISLDPEHNRLLTEEGKEVRYDWLVVAAGLQILWDKIPGLQESLGRNGVCSNYAFETVDTTWKAFQEFRGGNAIFTNPSGAIKCGGAPQKIMYLADDYFRRTKVRDQARILFASASPDIFAVDKYRTTLEKVVARKGIECLFRHELVEILPDQRQAVFQNVETGERVTLPYSLLHVTPPMGPPSFLAESPMVDEQGWVDVDRSSLRHNRFPNVFALGDCANLPTSKTGAAIRKQAPVLVANLVSAMRGETGDGKYDGYTSCPVVTGYGLLVLAEFDYDKKPAETFPFDQSKERWSMWLLKRYVLPLLYWHGMLKGRA